MKKFGLSLVVAALLCVPSFGQDCMPAEVQQDCSQSVNSTVVVTRTTVTTQQRFRPVRGLRARWANRRAVVRGFAASCASSQVQACSQQVSSGCN
jgi:hypothetical protein